MKLRVVFPNRGNPPPAPVGYEQEPGNPFAFTLKWPSCVFHGLDNGHHVCGMYLKSINQNDCLNCTTRIQLPEGDGR